MKFNKEAIKTNSKRVCEVMVRMYHYSFAELQKFSKLSSTDLCLALIQLLQEGKIQQDKDEEGIYYSLV